MRTSPLHHGVHLLLALLMAVGALTALPSAATAASGRLTVRPAIAGERTTATGVVPVRAKKTRPVVLQRKSGSRWVTVARSRTSKRGAFTLKHTQRSVSTRYRVLAPTAGKARKTATPTRAVTPLAQKVGVTVPAGARPGAMFATTVKASPARPGRTVTIQRLDGDRWVTADRGAVDAKGTYRGAVGAPSARGTLKVRAVLSARAGAPSLTSAVATLEVDQGSVVSYDENGNQTPHPVQDAVADRTGRHLAFSIRDENDHGRILVRDTQAGRTTRVALTSDGSDSLEPLEFDLSADGRFLVFAAIRHGDTSGSIGLYLWDRDSGQTKPLSVDQHGTPIEGRHSQPSISADGRHVAFVSTSSAFSGPQAGQVVRLDRSTGVFQRVSPDPVDPDSPSNLALGRPRVCDDGSVGFATRTALVDADTNKTEDLYLTDPGGATRPLTLKVGGRVSDFDVDAGCTTIAWSRLGTVSVLRAGELRTLAATATRVRLSADGSLVSGVRTQTVAGAGVSLAVAIRTDDGRSQVVSRPHPGTLAAAEARSAGSSGDGRLAYYLSGSSQYTNAPQDGPDQVVAQSLRW